MDTYLNRQYPIGEFVFDESNFNNSYQEHISYFQNFPSELEEYIKSVPENDYANQYRENSWTIRQLVHHLADSHINLFIRVKFALTESNPSIKGYDEVTWADLKDVELPLEASLMILSGVHARMSRLFRDFTPADWERTYFHSGYARTYALKEVLLNYVWHCKHHLAHIKIAHDIPWKQS